MAYIAKRFKVINVGEMREHLRNQKPFPTRSILITFDDGWKDNYLHAMPILKKNNIPALIFLSTGFIGKNKQFWQEKMARLLWTAVDMAKLNPEMGNELQALFKTLCVRKLIASQDIHRHIGIQDMILNIKRHEYTEIYKQLHSLENMITQSVSFDKSTLDGEIEFLSWDEVKKMIATGIYFGSHGVNHKILDKKGVDIDFELQNSKIEIEQKLGTSALTFSYPNGNYNRAIADKVKSNGYALGFGTKFGYNSSNADHFTLRRININQNLAPTIPRLMARISGII
jgi:peptidoglycan/xylan/chitin deacetylase (PgdA/CDA1 family)